jgi:hypothetical protein
MIRVARYKLSKVCPEYWDFVHKYGTIYQSKTYLECLAASGREPTVVTVFEDDKLVGGAGITTGRKILNFPVNMSTYFGPVVSDVQKAVSVLKCIADAIKTMCLRFSVTALPEYANVLVKSPELSNWHKREIEFIYWDISNQMETYWKRLPKGKKAAVNRARREGVIIQEITTNEDVKQFHRLHIMSMSREEVVVTSSLSYYKNLINILKPKGLATGFLALHPQTKQSIAAVILLLDGHNTAIYYAVGHDYEHRNFGATDFLVWHCLEFLKPKGYTIFDFVGLPKGDSPRAEGICHFKTSWAGEDGHRCPSYVLTRGNFGLNPQMLGKAADCVKKIIGFCSRA